MRSHNRTSRSKPSQPDDVPFQAITLTFACASNSAAARISESSNCASAGPDNAISVTLKREKCAVTPSRPASIAAVTGSSTVFDDGVSIPSRTRSVIGSLAILCATGSRFSASHEERRALFHEGARGFLVVLGLSGLDLALRLDIEQLGQGSVLGRVEVMFHQAERNARPFRQLAREIHGGIGQLGVAHDPV